MTKYIITMTILYSRVRGRVSSLVSTVFQEAVALLLSEMD